MVSQFGCLAMAKSRSHGSLGSWVMGHGGMEQWREGDIPFLCVSYPYPSRCGFGLLGRSSAFQTSDCRSSFLSNKTQCGIVQLQDKSTARSLPTTAYLLIKRVHDCTLRSHTRSFGHTHRAPQHVKSMPSLSGHHIHNFHFRPSCTIQQ